MSFDPKNKADKAQLHSVIIAVAELDNLRYDDVLDLPFETPWARGADYKRNVRSGEFSSIRAKVIYDWLMDQHFETAHKFAPDIFPQTPEMRLREIVDEHAIEGQLRIVLASDELGIVQSRSASTKADQTLKLGQDFYFELDVEEPGYAAAFQVVRSQWHPIELTGENVFSIALNTGINRLPQLPSGQIDPINESHDLGQHEFVLFVAQKDILPISVSSLLHAFGEENITIHRLAVQFVE